MCGLSARPAPGASAAPGAASGTGAPPAPRECARQIVDAFADYNAQFRAITRRAPLRFDTRGFKGSQRDAVERIELYDRCVNQTIAALRLALAAAATDRGLWQQMRLGFPTPELTPPAPR